ncbi:uncharacterized protein LOC128958570 [Oppia nitens]|uniref:uncharacterized protein LOC128958570 n=1 Tax=Oppia nitens TaxID=1686743 RepID=UPI0023DCB2C2|nr:uncharacterized protein LOC128958570 [Oppia nitens]
MWISYSIVILLIVSLFEIPVSTLDFCETYLENGQQIHYGFRRLKLDERDSVYYMFIGTHYWDLEFDNNIDHTLKSVSLWRTESRQSQHWYGSHYSMALCLWRPIEQYCVFGLINSNKTLIDFRVRVPHAQHDRRVKGYDKIAETSIEFNDNFDPSIVFVPNGGQFTGKYAVFVEQKSVSFNHFVTNTRLYEFDDNFKGRYVVCNLTYCDDIYPKVLTELDQNLVLLSVWGQEGLARNKNLTLGYINGLMLVFKFDKIIKYCWTPDTKLSDNCKTANLKTLIDCTNTTVNIITTTPETQQHQHIYINDTDIELLENFPNFSEDVVTTDPLVINDDITAQPLGSDDSYNKHDNTVASKAWIYAIVGITALVVSLLIGAVIYKAIKYKINKNNGDIDLEVLEDQLSEVVAEGQTNDNCAENPK